MTANEMKPKLAELDAVIAEHASQPGSLMPVLQQAQEIFGYVPYEVQVRIAEGLGITLSDVYGVATFYSQFSLEPSGEHTIGVCMGTACYVRGSQRILDECAKVLNVEVGKTTEDNKFTLTATRCLGACGLAPVLMVDDEVYGRLEPGDVKDVFVKY